MPSIRSVLFIISSPCSGTLAPVCFLLLSYQSPSRQESGCWEAQQESGCWEAALDETVH